MLRAFTTTRALVRPALRMAARLPAGHLRNFSAVRDRVNEEMARATGLRDVSEVAQRAKMLSELRSAADGGPALQAPLNGHTPQSLGLSKEEFMRLVECGMTTFLLHVQSRIMSYIGEGFYTLSPCGEEAIGSVGLALQQHDPSSLHYRHVAIQMVRYVSGGHSIDEVILDRARGYTVSSLDPVTGGVHCSIGGGDTDYLITSTLSSQTPPAVGRAMAIPLLSHLGVDGKFSKDSLSFVTVGDGSVNNAHFLAGMNLAEYAAHRGRRCPVLFGITDNDRCISLRGYGWLRQFVSKVTMPLYTADGNDTLDVYAKARDAMEYIRTRQRPAMLVMDGVSRRFGHAATDRQLAYLSRDEVQDAADMNPLLGMAAQAVDAGFTTYGELADLFETLNSKVEAAFDQSTSEPKIATRQQMLDRTSAPMAPMPSTAVRPPMIAAPSATEALELEGAKPDGRKVQMRMHMNAVIDETLNKHKHAVYIGEDVRHGGYYLVTDKLVQKHPDRVQDFPPDETTLVGAGMGFSQAGLLPIVEIPYAKYLDCGADMFFEAVISNWLSNGRQPNGMVIRLQGFDLGVFGGNFHTHNSLHIPPGLDVVCYSNGRDYARGFRHLVRQAAAGRMVMSVDSTNLLNLRHVHAGDEALMLPLTGEDEEMDFDTVRTYGAPPPKGTRRRLAIVSYGNGVVTSLKAAKELAEKHGVDDVVVIDSPYLSSPPGQLRELLPGFDSVVFADVCKMGQHPFAGFVTALNNDGLLPAKWRCIGACPSYNPLGSTVTFLSVDDIVGAALAVSEP